MIVVLVVTLTHRPAAAGPIPTPPASNARAILDERYARGEIDHDEYIRRRNELGRSGG